MYDSFISGHKYISTIVWLSYQSAHRCHNGPKLSARVWPLLIVIVLVLWLFIQFFLNKELNSGGHRELFNWGFHFGLLSKRKCFSF